MSDYKKLGIPAVADMIADAKNAMIICHVSPDGDTVGSAFALKGIIEAAGGRAVCKCAQEPPAKLHCLYLSQDSVLYSPGDEENCDLIMSVDVASPSQLGALESISDKISLMLDHHAAGEAFADNYIDETASSAAEVVYLVYRELVSRGVICELPNVARRMYAAIVSDTGSFRFANTTSRTMRIAADLLDVVSTDPSGKSASDFAADMFGTRTRKEITAQKIALENLEYIGDDVSLLCVSADDMEANDLTEDDVGNIVDLGRNIDGIKVALALKQSVSDRHVFRLSTRANCDTDLARICFDSFGGGGHKRAAGATLYASTTEEAKAAVIGAFAEKYKEYLK